jgi:hypothetical protein
MIIKISVALMFCLALLADGCESKSGGTANTAPSNSQQTVAASSANSSEVKNEGRPAPVTNPANSEAVASTAADVCALIEKSEIEAVQGRPVQSAAPSQHTTGGLTFSQCYYTVMSADGSKNLSVHLQVIGSVAKSRGRNVVREFWEEKLKREKGRDEEEEEEEGEAGKPLPVSGLGDEAFWIGNNSMGAIYTLKNDKIVRISVGGPGDAKTRIEKSETLARKSLQRLK